jgi:uncharacterized protein
VTARSELRLGVGDLLHRPGTRREVERELKSVGLAVAASTVPAGATIALSLAVESTADPGTLTVTGTVSAPWAGECRRCLDPVHGEIETEVSEVFARRPVDDEIWELEGEEIDLAALAFEALLLALPLAPLCGPDCRGPAPEAFPAVVEDDGVDIEGGTREGDRERTIDPRWSALDDLRFDD